MAIGADYSTDLPIDAPVIAGVFTPSGGALSSIATPIVELLPVDIRSRRGYNVARSLRSLVRGAMYRSRLNRWFVVIALVGAFLIVWNRVRIVFFVQLNLVTIFILFAVLAVGIYVALRLLFSR
jgi:hypothetical protein